MPQNRHFTPSPADALFQNACILSTSTSLPCWTSPEVSCRAGESAPKSRESPALSRGEEAAGATRDGCRADAPASHGEKCTKIAGLGYTIDKELKRRALDIQQREKTCRPRHKREGPAAKRWEGLVFSTAECSRGTRAIEKVVTITRFRRHLPGTGSAIAGLVRGRDCRTTGSLSLR